MDSAPRLLSIGHHYPALVVPHAAPSLAERIRGSPHDTTFAHQAQAQTLPRPQTLCGPDPKASLCPLRVMPLWHRHRHHGATTLRGAERVVGGLYGGAGAGTGHVSVNVVPWPASLATVICPRWAVTISWTR